MTGRPVWPSNQYKADRARQRRRRRELEADRQRRRELEARVRALCANVREVTRTWLLQLDARARRR